MGFLFDTSGASTDPEVAGGGAGTLHMFPEDLCVENFVGLIPLDMTLKCTKNVPKYAVWRIVVGINLGLIKCQIVRFVEVRWSHKRDRL